MEILRQRILKDGVVKEGNILKVDSFLNHQIDISLLNEIGREFYRLFGKKRSTKSSRLSRAGLRLPRLLHSIFMCLSSLPKRPPAKY